MTGTWCPGNEQRPSRLHRVARVPLAIWLPAIDAMLPRHSSFLPCATLMVFRDHTVPGSGGLLN